MICKNSKPGLAALAAAISLCWAMPAVAGITIDPAQNYIVGTRPSGAAIGDFNSNGHLDLATVVDNPDRVVTLVNNGSGQYALGPSFILPSSSSPQDIIAGDFNNDGHTDLAVAVRDPVGAVIILNGTGAGTFVHAGTFNVGVRPRGLSTGDINGNGFLDIAVANRDSDNASVLFNNGGSFTVVTISVGQEPRATVLADFTGNGMRDLAVTNHDDRTVSVFTYIGGTSFSLSQVLFVGSQVRPEGIAAADLNNNGMIDIVVAASGTNFNHAGVFFNTGAGFTGPSNFPTGGQNSDHIVAADLDCDGWIDLATSNQDSNNISIMRNVGGSFTVTQISPAGTRPGRIHAGDLSGNGAPDLVVANRDSDSLTVHLNTSEGCDEPEPPTCPGDLNGDGNVGVADLLQLLACWGPVDPGSGCEAADLTDSGTVGVADLLQLLSVWGPCPR